MTPREGTDACARGDNSRAEQWKFVKRLLDIITARHSAASAGAASTFNPDRAFDQIESEYTPEITSSNAFVRAITIAYIWRSLCIVTAKVRDK